MKSKGETSREKILESAKKLFNNKGFNATTISDLVDATGMQKGSLYFHFDSKDEIAFEVLKEATKDFISFLDTVLDGNNPGMALDNFFRAALEKHISTGFVGGCIFGNTALEMSDTNLEFAKMIEDVFDSWIQKISNVVKRAQDIGQIRDDIHYAQLAGYIVGAIEGGIMISRLKKDERPMRATIDTLRTTLELKL